MLVKFLKPWSIFKVGETTDMMRSKAAQLKSEGIITDNPHEIRGLTLPLPSIEEEE